MRLDPLLLVEYMIEELGAGFADAAEAVAICKAESNLITDRVGVADPGDAGLWQINLDQHPKVTREQANDWKWATVWAWQHRGDGWAPWNVVRSGAWKAHHQLGWVTVRLYKEREEAMEAAEDRDVLAAALASLNEAIDRAQAEAEGL